MPGSCDGAYCCTTPTARPVHRPGAQRYGAVPGTATANLPERGRPRKYGTQYTPEDIAELTTEIVSLRLYGKWQKVRFETVAEDFPMTGIASWRISTPVTPQDS